jgi:hypothetical protein
MMPSEDARSGEVHQGRNGWLFLIGGSNRVIEYYTMPDGFPDANLHKWLALLQERCTRAERLGAQYLHMVAPDKLTIYRDEFDGELPYWANTPALKIPAAAKAAGLENLIIDVVPYLIRQKAFYKLFWQTDTHWTFEGALCAYQMLCSKLGIDYNMAVPAGARRSGMLLLDLGAKLVPPLREEFTIVNFQRNARRVAVNPIVAYKEKAGHEGDGGLHVGSNVVFYNTHSNAIDKAVILFGDSFSEYRSHLLTGMLAETFRELHFVWSTSVDWSYVERVKPDLLITEAAERFANQVPDDKFDIDRYVIKLLAPRI